MRAQIISGWLACAVIAGSAAAVENDFETGRKLLQAGRDAEAFRAFIEVPGAEHLAVRVARPKAAEFLALLADLPANIPVARVQIIAGDLHLAQGNKGAALRCYWTAAAKLAAGEYYVEWSRAGASAQAFEFDFSERPVRPFDERQPVAVRHAADALLK